MDSFLLIIFIGVGALFFVYGESALVNIFHLRKLIKTFGLRIIFGFPVQRKICGRDIMVLLPSLGGGVFRGAYIVQLTASVSSQLLLRIRKAPQNVPPDDSVLNFRENVTSSGIDLDVQANDQRVIDWIRKGALNRVMHLILSMNAHPLQAPVFSIVRRRPFGRESNDRYATWRYANPDLVKMPSLIERYIETFGETVDEILKWDHDHGQNSTLSR